MNINDKTFPDYWEKYLNQTLSKDEVEKVTNFLDSNPEWKNLVEDKRPDLVLTPDETIEYPHKDALCRKIIWGDFFYRTSSIAAAFLVLVMLGIALWNNPMEKEPLKYHVGQSLPERIVSETTVVAMNHETEPIVSKEKKSSRIAKDETENTVPLYMQVDSLSATQERNILETNSLVTVLPIENPTSDKIVFTEQLVLSDPLEITNEPYDDSQIVYTQTLVAVKKSGEDSIYFPHSCSFLAVLGGRLRFSDFASCVQEEVSQRVSAFGTTVAQKAADWRDNLFARNSRK